MDKVHMLSLKKDEDVMDAIHAYLKDKAWKSAVIVGGVGSIYDVEVGNPGAYEMPPPILTKTVQAPCEIVSFMGEITHKDNLAVDVPDHVKDTPSDYFVHIHMTFSHGEGNVSGGGFRRATVLRGVNVYMIESA